MTAARAYIIAHWRGELSLAKSFLLNGVLAYFVLVVSLVGLGTIIASKAFLYGGMVLFALWEIWAVVGTVRSAFRTYRQPRSTFGPMVARRGFAVLAIVVTAAFVYGTLADLRMLLGGGRTAQATIHR